MLPNFLTAKAYLQILQFGTRVHVSSSLLRNCSDLTVLSDLFGRRLPRLFGLYFILFFLFIYYF